MKKKASSSSTAKYKNMMYTQQMEHLPFRTREELEERIKTKLAPKKYAISEVHDKDIDEDGNPVKEHIHVMLCFQNARSLKNVASILGDKPQYLEKWDERANNGIAYLVHATSGAKVKAQYSPEKVLANFPYAEELKKQTLEVLKKKSRQKIDVLLDAYYNEEMTLDELEQELTGAQYGRYKKQIDTITSKILERHADIWRQDMLKNNRRVKVIWIYGAAGTGKTSLARSIAKQDGRAYYVSGSSRDVFQSYNGEHILILDELRSNVIPYHDLLRILDPFGNQERIMAPARYSDKSLACDLIIITTPFNPVDFYDEIFDDINTVDSLEQLVRRITITLYVNSDSISAVRYCQERRHYYAVPDAECENPYSQKNRPDSEIDVLEEFNQMFK